MLPRLSDFSRAQVLLFALICTVSLGLYWYMTTRAFVTIDIDVGHSTNFRIYWAHDKDETYDDNKSSLIKLTRPRNTYSTVLTDLRDIDHLRIDPTNIRGLFRIKAINIYQAGYKTIRIHKEELKNLKARNQVALLEFDQEGLVYYATDHDSNFTYDLNLEPEPDSWLTHLFRLAVMVAIGLLLLRTYPLIPTSFSFVPYAMGLVLVLITIMAIISRPHAHPDEHAHIAAAQYFENNLSLPQVCTKDTLPSYTVYGTSRLNADELTYYVAGRYLQLVDFIPVKTYVKLRFFNVLLFALLLLLAVRNPQARLLLTPMLLSPQLWYLFSYFNSDASALLAAFVIGNQVISENSSFRKLLSGKVDKVILPLIGLGFLATFLFLTKKNFYFFTLFLFASAALLALPSRKHWQNLIQPAKSLGVIILLGLIGYSTWHFSQNVVNDFTRRDKVIDCREQTADTAYKPSTPIEDQNWSLSLDKRDISIPTMLSYGWVNAVFKSAFGNYGYVELPATQLHYLFVKLILALLVLSLIWQVMVRGNGFQRSVLALNLALFIGLILITIYKSWTVDFQPQGRYYFAMAPIFGVTLVWLQSVLNKRLLSALMLLLFTLATVSFVLYGLLDIAKVS